MSEELEQKKRPASQYYWGDWWKDKGLHSCSLTARGLWHEMNCLMHEGEPYGHLTLNSRPMTAAQLANQCRISKPQCTKMLDELEAAGVFSRNPEGVIFSRRMVRDEAIRNARAAGGKAGAEHGFKGAEHGSKGGRPKGSEGGYETPLDGPKKPPPSSSSSSSPSGNTPTTTAGVSAQAGSLEVFPVHEHWAPSQTFATQAKLLGLPVLDPASMQAGISEFVAFWIAKPHEVRTQAEWENALAKSLKHRQVKAASQPPQRTATMQAERPLTPAERAAYAASPHICNERVRRLMQAEQAAQNPSNVIDMEANNGTSRLLG